MDKLIELLESGKFVEATVETLFYVVTAMGIGGVLGLIIGVALTVTRQGGLLDNRVVFWVLNFLVNFFRPIPFVILIAALQPLARLTVGTSADASLLTGPDVSSMANGFRTLMDPQRRRAMSSASAKLLPDLSPERTAERYVAAYNDLIERKATRG